MGFRTSIALEVWGFVPVFGYEKQGCRVTVIDITVLDRI